jgi:hypothetical protein
MAEIFLILRLFFICQNLCLGWYYTPLICCYSMLGVGDILLYSTFGKSLCTYKRCWKWCPGTIVSKNWIKQLHTLPVLQFNRCLTTKYSETTANFNGNFDTDNQIYVPWPKCTATFRKHCISSYIVCT